MSIELVKIDGGGSVGEEYVLLKAKADCNLKGWVIADTTFDTAGEPSNKTRHTFWFPSTAVKAGDHLAVFTKAGSNKLGKTASDGRCHYFYWNLGAAVWNNDADTAVLLRTHATQRKKTV